MESKWYLFPGQTVSNTKISDRAHALHITNKAWGNITKHLDRNRLHQEALDKEKAHRKALKEGSQKMTKQWPNSLDNICLRKEQERLDQINQKKDDRIQLFYKMKAEQEVERKKLVDKIKKNVFISSGTPKELTSALISSSIVQEREKQLEFDAFLKSHQDEDALKYAAKVKRDAEEERQENAEKERKRLEANKKYGLELLEQIELNGVTSVEAKKALREKERVDYAHAEEEIRLLEEFELNKKIQNIRDKKLERKRDLERERERQRIIAQEEKEIEMAAELTAAAYTKMACMMKTKQKEMKEAESIKREENAEKLAEVMRAISDNTERLFAAVMEEKNAEEDAKEAAKQEAIAKLIKERLMDRDKFVNRQKQEKHIEEELKKWEMLNRIKTSETITNHNQQLAEDKWSKILNYRKDLQQQIADNKATVEENEAIDREMSKVCFKEADEMFFNYAKEVLEEAKSKNQNTYAIERVIHEYEKTNGLLKKDTRRCTHKRHCK